MFKNGANTARDLKTFGNSNSKVKSDVIIRLDSGGDPTPGANVGKILYMYKWVRQTYHDCYRFRNQYN